MGTAFGNGSSLALGHATACAAVAPPTALLPTIAPSTPSPAAVVGTGTGGSNSDLSCPAECIPPSPPALDCGNIQHRRFRVIGADPYRFDGDGNGIGCEAR